MQKGLGKYMGHGNSFLFNNLVISITMYIIFLTKYHVEGKLEFRAVTDKFGVAILI